MTDTETKALEKRYESLLDMLEQQIRGVDSYKVAVSNEISKISKNQQVLMKDTLDMLKSDKAEDVFYGSLRLLIAQKMTTHPLDLRVEMLQGFVINNFMHNLVMVSSAEIFSELVNTLKETNGVKH